MRSRLLSFRQELCAEFQHKDSNIVHITKKLVHFVDVLLIELFEQCQLHEPAQFCLLALGSYGRRELQLYSDIDLILLYRQGTETKHLQKAERFIRQCWDVGLEISCQIIDVEGIAKLAAEDVSIISSLMDMHLICGRGGLMEDLIYSIHPLNMWSSKDYFLAKEEELKRRHQKYGESAYHLEPNIKYGAGGLRDVNTLLSIGKRHFGIHKLADGIAHGLISEREYEELCHGERFLWRVRFALHMIADKPEERLLFDWQIKLAKLFGYQDNQEALGIEQFMKNYFKIIKHNREISDMLMQWFKETIIPPSKQSFELLDDYFQISGNYIEVRNPALFERQPAFILSLFLWIVKRPDIQGVRAGTIRLIRSFLPRMNKKIKQSLKATKTFMALLRQQESPYEALQRMNRYGVLAHYLDAFEMVTGQMQYDLFHIYTVDQHTLYVIRNIGRFQSPEFKQQFPLAHELIHNIHQKDILYLAALFHDIAKGRGGDHSELGAKDARQFAKRHRLSQNETELLCWLVANHLLMSTTAQRKDIYDLDTIKAFCSKLPAAHYLEYLYLLTVADICATNPGLWTSWKDSLLKELYKGAHRALMQEQALIDEHDLILARQQAALIQLSHEHIDSSQAKMLWAYFKPKYFLHETPEMIARHTLAIIQSSQFPVILIMPHHSQGGTEVFLYQPHRAKGFAITTAILSNHGMTIQEASIMRCDNQHDLDIYVILNDSNQAFLEKHVAHQLKNELFHALNQDKLPKLTKRRQTRAQAHFNRPPKISWPEHHNEHQSAMLLITNDRPGILASIAKIFYEHQLILHSAKIATAGDRVEDVFILSSATDGALTDEQKLNLARAITEIL